MTFNVTTYSPKDVILTMAGYQVIGWTSISVQSPQGIFLPIKGIRGKHTRVPIEDASATISIALSQTSPSNDVFSRIAQLDSEFETGCIDLLLKDRSGRTVFESHEAYITANPNITFTDTIEERVWTMFCQKTLTNIGGNTRPSTSLFDSVVDRISNIF